MAMPQPPQQQPPQPEPDQDNQPQGGGSDLQQLVETTYAGLVKLQGHGRPSIA
jgi:hypothetical protein